MGDDAINFWVLEWVHSTLHSICTLAETRRQREWHLHNKHKARTAWWNAMRPAIATHWGLVC